MKSKSTHHPGRADLPPDLLTYFSSNTLAPKIRWFGPDRHRIETFAKNNGSAILLTLKKSAVFTARPETPGAEWSVDYDFIKINRLGYCLIRGKGSIQRLFYIYR